MNSEYFKTKLIKSWREPLRNECKVDTAVTPRHERRSSDAKLEVSTGPTPPDSVDTLVQLMKRAITLLHTTTPTIESSYCFGDIVVASGCTDVASQIGDSRTDESNEPYSVPTSLTYDLNESSPLTLAVNKSLDMSKSLTEHCTRLGDLTTSSEEGEGEDKMDGARDTSINYVVPEPATVCLTKLVVPLQGLTSNEVLRRRRIAQEILDTERKYCACLSTVLDHFRMSVKSSAIISDDDVNTMFPACLEIIRSYHRQFLQKLGDRLNSSEWQCIFGDVFASFIMSPEGDLFAQYQLYVKGFSETVLFMRKTSRQNSSFKKLVLKLETDACCEGLGIDAFLHAPVQRMPRYILLLKQLLRNTSTNHPDYYNITVCLDKLSHFLERLNETIEQSLSLVLCETSSSHSRKPKRARFSFTSRGGASAPNARAAVLPVLDERKWPAAKEVDVGQSDSEQRNCTGKENLFSEQTRSSHSFLDKSVPKDLIEDNESFLSSSYGNVRSMSKSKITKHQIELIGAPEQHSTPFRTNLVLRQGKMMWNGRATLTDKNNPRKRKYPSSKTCDESSSSFPPGDNSSSDNHVFNDFKCPTNTLQKISSSRSKNSLNVSDVSFTKLQSKSKYKSIKGAFGLGRNGQDNPSFAFERSDTLKTTSDEISCSQNFSDDCNRDILFAYSEMDVQNNSATPFVSRVANEKNMNQSMCPTSPIEATNTDRSFFVPKICTVSEMSRESSAEDECNESGKNVWKSSCVSEIETRNKNKKSYFDEENRKILETEENAIKECKMAAAGKKADSNNKIVNIDRDASIVDCDIPERTSNKSTSYSQSILTTSPIDQKVSALDSTMMDSHPTLSEVDAAATDVFAKPFSGAEPKEKTLELPRLNVSFFKPSVFKPVSMSTESVVTKRGLFRRWSSKKESSDVSIANESVVQDMSFGDTSTSVKRKPSFTDSIRKLFVKKRPGKVQEEDSIIEDPSVDRST